MKLSVSRSTRLTTSWMYVSVVVRILVNVEIGPSIRAIADSRLSRKTFGELGDHGKTEER